MFSQNSSKEYIFSLVGGQLADYLQSMKDTGERRHIPNISWNTSRFFIEKFSRNPRFHLLEIGSANGFSTMMLSLACPQATLTTIEFSRHAFEELRHNIEIFNNLSTTQNIEITAQHHDPAHLGHKITSSVDQQKIGRFSLYFGDAREILPAFVDGSATTVCSHPASTLHDIPQQRFDCVFIDGAFRMTREFFDLSYPLVSPGGVIIIDDVIKYRWKMNNFHEYLESASIPYEIVQTDEDDGIMLIQKMTSEMKDL